MPRRVRPAGRLTEQGPSGPAVTHGRFAGDLSTGVAAAAACVVRSRHPGPAGARPCAGAASRLQDDADKMSRLIPDRRDILSSRAEISTPDLHFSATWQAL
jgi:hypothetical protein